MSRPWVSYCLKAAGVLAIVSGLAVLLASGQRTSAASRLTDDFAELLQMAQVAAQVRIGELHVEAGRDGGIPLTVARCEVEAVRKGDLAGKKQIEVECFGATVGSVETHCPGQAQLASGETALLLLVKNQSDPNRWRVLGGDVGQVALAEDGAGSKIARRMSGAFDYFVPEANSPSGWRRIKTAVVTQSKLTALVEALLTTGRPEIAERSHEMIVPPKETCQPAPRVMAEAAPETGLHLLGRLTGVLLIATGLWLGLRLAGRN
ncbi:MAG TPA: hypothetical protein VGP72_07015 [Planctomycetota bacterium]